MWALEVASQRSAKLQMMVLTAKLAKKMALFSIR